MRRRIGMLLLCVCLFGVFGCTEDPMENVEMDDYDGNFATQSTILQKGAETEQGIYWDYGGLILYMDKDSQAVTVLCSKPNCTHLNEDCDGRIGDTVSSLASLQEYAGKIYIYKVNVDKEPELARDFGIQSIPTIWFVPMKGEPQVNMGALSKEQLKGYIDKVLLKQ